MAGKVQLFVEQFEVSTVGYLDDKVNAVELLDFERLAQ